MKHDEMFREKYGLQQEDRRWPLAVGVAIGLAISMLVWRGIWDTLVWFLR